MADLNFEEREERKGGTEKTVAQHAPVRRGLNALIGNNIIGRNNNAGGRLTELTEKMAKGFGELELDTSTEATIYPVTKTDFPNLEYPGLLCVLGGSAVLLVVTDSKTISPTTMVQGLGRGEQNLFLRSDVIDNVYAEACSALTDAALIDAYLVTPELELNESVISELIIVTHDIMTDFNNKSELGEEAFVNLAEILTNDVDVNCVEQSISTDATTVTGNKKRADWMLTTSAEERAKRTFSPNNGGASAEINRLSGYVDLIPVIMETIERGQPVRTNAVVPEIVINNVLSQSVITEHALLAIATASLITSDYKWVQPLVDNISEIKNPSAFDKFLDIESKYTAKGVSRQQKINNITASITDAPRLKLTVEKGSIDDSTFSLFGLAADYNNSDSVYAKEDIVKCAHLMTNKNFNAAFDINNIFTSTELPTGYFFDNKGNQKDLAEIDIMYCYSISEELAIRYERILLGIDPADYIYTVYSELEQTLGLDIHLTGRKFELTFTADFIHELTTALANVGFSPYVEPSNVVAKAVGYDYTVAATAGTFIRGGVSLGRVRGQAGYGPVGRPVGSYRHYRR